MSTALHRLTVLQNLGPDVAVVLTTRETKDQVRIVVIIGD